MRDLPPRYEPVRCLGAGGGGEVWSVRDRATGRIVALKVLASNAGHAESQALVREAIALSGLEGMGLPRVVAFGTLRGGRRYMVREMVEGRSLDDLLQNGERAPWIEALARACDQLTIVHRAGLLHGDIKPANVIVGPDGRGTWVDLGLAAPWREGGTVAQGMTPKYAAPELLLGEPLTMRAEIYALGATLTEALGRRGDELKEETRLALAKVAARATESISSLRWPSVDELASALRLAAGLGPSDPADAPWPVLGADAAGLALIERVRQLEPGAGMAIEGPPGSGRTTLVRRLAWTLGVEGRAVGFIEPPTAGLADRGMVMLELDVDHAAADRVIVVDDGDRMDGPARDALRQASAAGARLIMVAPRAAVEAIARGPHASFTVPPLPVDAATELVRRAVPSLSNGLHQHLFERTGRRPGALRAAVRRVSGRALVCENDVDRALDEERDSAEPASRGRGPDFAAAERALDRGRLDDAADALRALEPARGDGELVRLGIGRARVAIGRGDATRALAELAAIEPTAMASNRARAFCTVRARAHLRAGLYEQAVRLAEGVVQADAADADAADALSVRGVALALMGDDAGARETLDRAVKVARTLGSPRLEAVALGSAAIAHQRAGRSSEARADYLASLSAAERAEDAATVATVRLNLAGLAQAEGELAQALVHLDAAVDMGRRAGNGAAVTQALLNLANLDLYLGRWAHARASIEQLAARREELSPAARAQLLGLEAEHAARTGDSARATQLYEGAALAWEAQGRAPDAAESRLEALLSRARAKGGDPPSLARELEEIRATLREAGFGEHDALAELVRGVIAQASGDEDGARRSLDAAIEAATQAGRREWAWQALDARARLAAAQGAVATARRDTEVALAMLEEFASKLPRDLREVFWDDPRRRALRQAHTATVISPGLISAALVAQPLARTPTTAGGNTSLYLGRLAEDRLARILELTRELASEHDIERLLQRVTDHAVALLGAERGFVLLHSEAGELEAHTARTRSGGDDPHARFSRSVAERVVQNGEPVVTVSARDDERLAHAVSVHQLMIQSIACVPIRGAPPVLPTIGALYVETRLRAGVRFEQELPTLLAFADQAAIAIENARLLAENRARADDLARANADLAAARDEIARTLGKRTEQLALVRRDLKQVRAKLRGHFGYAGLVGTSTAMRRLYALIERVKDTDIPLLVTGESGTGKEVVARAIHEAGPRAKRPFIGVNCGAIPANLLESELFGAVKGAFTGADRDRRGLLQEAEGGTLLLDEIGEMPQKMQSGLLRVLQEKRVRPVGATREEAVDVRVVAATHRDLAQMVTDGRFREDLFYRLHVVELRVPPLRERVEDVPMLIDHFLAIFSARYRRERKTVSRDGLRKLCAFPWPGNVRQLEHVLLSAWLMTEGGEIGADDLELPSFAARATLAIDGGRRGVPTPAGARPPRADNQAAHKTAERERILSALAASNWNRVQAAKLIGIPRRTFYRRLKEFGIL
ncbi:MAG: sigma 54-interacting transcriptional regulator [Polyangiaceae bacterium]|jgi:transcriptional regulator with GAF, ATPase, and Fis domain